MKPARALAIALLALVATGAWAQEPPAGSEPDAAPAGEPSVDPADEPAATGDAAAAGEAKPPEEVAPTPPPVPPPDPDRIRFELPVGSGPGGGRVSGSADRLETVGEDEAVLEGDVEIRYRDVVMRAQRVVLHRETMTVEAEGDVVFDQGPRRIGASRLDFDLQTETGTFWDAAAYVEPDYYFSGAVLSKTGEVDYEIREGQFTSCTGDETPDWSIAMSRGDLELGGYGHARHGRLRLKKMPIFYWPYLVWPARTERTSGMLIPNIGYSARRGTVLGLAYYQVLGPSADGTLFLDLYSEEYAGLGAELRYRPSEGTTGKATFYGLHNPDIEAENGLPARPAGNEWKGRFEHTSNDLPWGMRGILYWEDYSDYDYFRQYERAERNNTRRYLYSNAFLSGTWGAHSLNVLTDQRETFLGSGETVTQRQLPEISYRMSKLKLGDSRLYLSMDSTASYLQSQRPDAYDVGYGRFDLSPVLTMPLRVAPWMSVSMSAGGRATWWGESVPETRVDPETGANQRYCGDEPVGSGVAFCGDALDRVVPSAALDLIGPSFSRIFEGGVGRFGKFKHLIEPRWSYLYTGAYDDQARVARFDEIDQFEATHVGEFALVNRVLAKPSDETQGGAFEIFSFELAQGYSFDRSQPLQRSRDGSITSQESGLAARMRFNPTRDFTLDGKAVWSTLFDGLSSTSLSAGADLGRVDLDLTWFTKYDPELGEKESDQARLSARVEILPRRLQLAGNVNYNLKTSQIQQQRYFLSWTSQCWSAVLEAREQVTASYTSRDYRFLLNLKNIGTFLDLNGGEATDR